MTALDERHAQLDDLHQRYHATKDPILRDELVRRYSRLSHSMAARVGDRAGDPEDIQQTAAIGLLKALDRFDPDRGVAFTTYAWATITGELKRFYRDSTWGVRVSRKLQERYLLVSRILDDLSNDLHRSPTLDEVAAAAGITSDEVAEAIELQHARRLKSIDAPARDDTPSPFEPVHDVRATDQIEDSVLLSGLLQRLPEREQRIVWMRFGWELSQSAIAARMGLSQMQVSRLLARSLAELREWAVVEATSQ